MRFPQLLIYETDGRLARMLEATAGTHRWVLRQPRQVDSFLHLVANGGPAIGVFNLDSDLRGALTLLERMSEQFPNVLSVAVMESDSGVCADLAWDLGATLVLTASQPRDLLLDAVASLMGAVAARAESD
jgi:hypothetical protein